MSKKVIIIGGEGNGGVVVSCIEDMQKRFNNTDFEIQGWLNDYVQKDEMILGYPVLGGLKDIDPFLKEEYYFIWAIHSITHAPMRIRLFHTLNIPDEKLLTIVHPLAFVGTDAKLGPGTVIMANAYIGPAANIDKCCLVLANAIIGHNTNVGPFCHFSAASVTSSYITIGEGVDVALNATILEKRNIGNFAVIGACAVVTKDVPERAVVVGNPARVIKIVGDN